MPSQTRMDAARVIDDVTRVIHELYVNLINLFNEMNIVIKLPWKMAYVEASFSNSQSHNTDNLQNPIIQQTNQTRNKHMSISGLIVNIYMLTCGIFGTQITTTHIQTEHFVQRYDID